jgi:hypothetical protein
MRYLTSVSALMIVVVAVAAFLFTRSYGATRVWPVAGVIIFIFAVTAGIGLRVAR